MKRIYVAGAGGMLGDAIFREFSPHYMLKCSDIDVNTVWLSYLDFRDEARYRQDVIDFQPDYLFHIGALTDLEFCETNPDDAYETNTRSVESAVRIANQLQIPILYISSAGIFDGSKSEFDDWDIPNPLCHYGRSKFLGEKFVAENTERHLILRPGWMMGGGPQKDKKFVYKILSQVKNGAKEIFVVNDKYGSPTYTDDLARVIRSLLESQLWGIYNSACEGSASRLEVAMEILRIHQLEDVVKLNSVPSSYFSKTYFAQRPASESLVNKKLRWREINLIRNWKDALLSYHYQHYSDFLTAELSSGSVARR